MKHVTQKPKEEIEQSPFPVFEWKPRSDTSDSESSAASKSKKGPSPKPSTMQQDGTAQSSPDSEHVFEHNEDVAHDSIRRLAESPDPEVVVVFRSTNSVSTCN